MNESLLGYATAIAEDAGTKGAEGGYGQLADDLAGFTRVLVHSAELGRALSDRSIPLSARRGVVEELLSDKALPATVRLVVYALQATPADEFHGAISTLAHRFRLLESGQPPPPDPIVAKSATRERIGGYANEVLAGLEGSAPLEEIEDELFRFARILEANPELRRALADGDTPVEYREDLAASLLEGRVNQATLRLVKYSLRAGRTRDLVGTFDWLSERVAAERGRRVARVRAAVALDQDERERLGEALSRRLGVPVEVQVVVDSSLVGGARVLVGDLAVDGTIRRRLDLIRETLTVPELPGLQPLAQTRPSGEDNTKNQGKELR